MWASTTRMSPRRFQSTLPVGGGTMAKFSERLRSLHFNPPSPWGEGLFCLLLMP